MRKLSEIWKKLKHEGYETDKGSVHSYIPLYDVLLRPYRKCKEVLEIGLLGGNSMRMWKEYFVEARVNGIDCNPIGLEKMIEEGYRIFIGDGTSKTLALTHFNDVKFDVIIEDAGHMVSQQVDMFSLWSKYWAHGGIYIIEDIQDVDKDGDIFVKMGGKIYDFRKQKGRYDDVIAVFYNNK